MDDQGQWLDELYRETGPQLLLYFRQRLGDTHGAEDLLQETFAAALRRADQVRATASARAYLFGIARNLLAREFRRRHETTPVPTDLCAEELPPDPKLEWMREAIGRLKPEFRETLELRLQHELSYEDLAEALGIPIGTVRSRLHHAVSQLRQAARRNQDFVLRKADR